MAKKVDYLMRRNSKVECILDCVECENTATALLDTINDKVYIKYKVKYSREKIRQYYLEDIDQYTKFNSDYITYFNKVLMIEDPSALCIDCLFSYFDPLIKKGKKKARKRKVEDAIIEMSYYTSRIFEILEHHFPLPVEEEEENEYEDKNIFLTPFYEKAKK